MKADEAEPPINVEQGLRYFGGDREYFLQTISSFDTVTLNTRMRTLHSAWKAQDYQLCEKESFQLKGGANSIAAKKLKDICKKLEEAAKIKNKAAVDKNYGDFLVESKRIKLQVARLTEATINIDLLEEYMDEYNVISGPAIRSGNEGNNQGNQARPDGEGNCGGACLLI